MSGSFFNLHIKIVIIIFIFIIFIIIFYSSAILGNPNLQNSLNTVSSSISNSENYSNYHNNIKTSYISNTNFIWPVPGFTTISSPFGYRYSPTYGASTYHSGIDIPASPGTNIFAAQSRESNFSRILWFWRLYYNY